MICVVSLIYSVIQQTSIGHAQSARIRDIKMSKIKSPSKDRHTYANEVTKFRNSSGVYINRMEKNTHMIISIDVCMLDKIQHPFKI